MAITSGLRLEFSDGGRLRETLANVNEALSVVGAGIRPLDLRDAPAEIRRLLGQASLSQQEIGRIRAQLLLSRERLLQVIAEAGRQPHVVGGGELNTYASTHDDSYPQMCVVQDNVDYSRFDHFHVNTAQDGTGTDEVLQLLWGGGLRVMLRIPMGGFLTLTLDCPDAEPGAGWLLTYDGARPHIGSLTRARPGTKLLVQVIGPPKWQMRYTSDA